MEHLKLRFDQILQADILFYDKPMEAACFDICNYLKMDTMPGITGNDYYELHNNEFHQKLIEPEHKVISASYIFSDSVYEQFYQNRHNVLFVFEEDVIVGVVHLSDYNRDVVLQCIQDDVLSFERKLRQLILLNGFSNADMKLYFENSLNKSSNKKDREFFENKIKRYDNNKDEIDSLGPFQIFEFSDLMNFAHTYGDYATYKFQKYNISGKNISSKGILRELRNMAMHGKNPIGRDSESLIYSIQSFKYLLDSLRVLRLEYCKIVKLIRGHPDFIRSIELENRSKLEIIHTHHPKALNYFLGF